MKICLISNLYPPYERGGAEQVVKNTVEGLLQRGFEVVIITARPFFAKKERIIERPGFKIYRFSSRNLFFYGHDYRYPACLRFFWHIFDFFNLYSFCKVRRILKKERPDAVHTHNLKGIGFLTPAAIRSLKMRHIHTLHDVQLAEPSGIIIRGAAEKWPYNFFLRRFYEKICRFLFGSPEVVISPSQFLLDFYERRGFFPQSKKVVIPNPVLPVAGGEGPARERRPSAVFNFLYVGQIETHKGVLFLIQSFKKLLLDFPGLFSNAFLQIAGSGSKMAEAKKIAGACPQIIFHGRAEREKLPEFFKEADITVVPSLCYENSPTVIFESFSFGVPVLASSIEGVAELIKDSENGLTFEAGNGESISLKMRWCLANREDLEKMRMAAQQSILGRGLDEYLDKLVSLCYNNRLS
ncbi:MAG: glycosyltransferase family 4 protein [Candidatus Magasanikbacteria bacterium]|nr:glycosyltransferase family 4 protein [Candidatus Magasanikbacteria bacterium]